MEPSRPDCRFGATAADAGDVCPESGRTWRGVPGELHNRATWAADAVEAESPRHCPQPASDTRVPLAKPSIPVPQYFDVQKASPRAGVPTIRNRMFMRWRLGLNEAVATVNSFFEFTVGS